jgi:hypothetical protein
MIDINIVNQYKAEENKPKSNGKSNYYNPDTEPTRIAENMIARAIDGEKHYVLCRASYLLGGYIASGAISENQARKSLRNAIELKQNVADKKAAYRTIDKCLEEGKSKPIKVEQRNIKDIIDEIENVDFDLIMQEDKSEDKNNDFPIDVFPYIIQTLIAEANRTLYFPNDYIASAILAAGSIALGRKIIVKVKEGWTEQAVLYIALV